MCPGWNIFGVRCVRTVFYQKVSPLDTQITPCISVSVWSRRIQSRRTGHRVWPSEHKVLKTYNSFNSQYTFIPTFMVCFEAFKQPLLSYVKKMYSIFKAQPPTFSRPFKEEVLYCCNLAWVLQYNIIQFMSSSYLSGVCRLLWRVAVRPVEFILHCEETSGKWSWNEELWFVFSRRTDAGTPPPLISSYCGKWVHSSGS